MRRVNTWRAKGNGGPKHDIKSYDYFIENNCVSCGYSFPDDTGREQINSLSDYKKMFNKLNNKVNWKRQGIHLLFDNVKKGDFIWTRRSGQYYVAEVTDSPENLFRFDAGYDATSFDCSAQLTNIEWHLVGTEDVVPGSVSVYNFRSAIGRIDSKESVYEINDVEYTSTGLFSALKSKALKNKDIKNNSFERSNLFNLIRYSSTEDLLALWLFDKFNYIVIPSTNKISTQKYEFVLLNASKNSKGTYTESKKIYIQVKNGFTNLKSDDYTSLLKDDNEEAWLMTTSGKIDNSEEKGGIMKLWSDNGKTEKKFFGINELIEFAFDPEKYMILPQNITTWVDFLKQ